MDSCLRSNEISILDKIGYMVKYIADAELLERINRMIDTAMQMGFLENIILTGINQDVPNIYIYKCNFSA